ncbi:MarR family transcriptional regulator [Streptomyces sp. NPDC005526]|uniref:MarR family winged helix-turn-helix transcriptional regulator n=1 Tax=Streptomyces sp. NPDC005526 TaxID=3156885 RepID=UPI0033B591BB
MSCEQGPEQWDRLARGVVDAVECVVALWFSAAEEITPGLPARQLVALKTVRHRPELNLTGLAEHLGIGLPTASRLCDRLEAAGLLERTLQPHNRREVQLVVTTHGQRLLAEVTEGRVRRLADVFRTMTPEQCAALHQGLLAFHRAHTAPHDRPLPPG